MLNKCVLMRVLSQDKMKKSFWREHLLILKVKNPPLLKPCFTKAQMEQSAFNTTREYQQIIKWILEFLVSVGIDDAISATLPLLPQQNEINDALMLRCVWNITHKRQSLLFEKGSNVFFCMIRSLETKSNSTKNFSELYAQLLEFQRQAILHHLYKKKDVTGFLEALNRILPSESTQRQTSQFKMYPEFLFREQKLLYKELLLVAESVQNRAPNDSSTNFPIYAATYLKSHPMNAFCAEMCRTIKALKRYLLPVSFFTRVAFDPSAPSDRLSSNSSSSKRNSHSTTEPNQTAPTTITSTTTYHNQTDSSQQNDETTVSNKGAIDKDDEASDKVDGTIGQDDGVMNRDGVIVSTSTSSESSSVESAVFMSSPFSLGEESQPQNMSTVDPTRISLHKRRIGVERTRMDVASAVDISQLDCVVWIPRELQYLDVTVDDNTSKKNKKQKTKNT